MVLLLWFADAPEITEDKRIGGLQKISVRFSKIVHRAFFLSSSYHIAVRFSIEGFGVYVVMFRKFVNDTAFHTGHRRESDLLALPCYQRIDARVLPCD